jgi:hypothetical protein
VVFVADAQRNDTSEFLGVLGFLFEEDERASESEYHGFSREIEKLIDAYRRVREYKFI